MITPDAEFDFKGNRYRIGLMDVFEQFHVARKLAPIVASMGMEMFKLISGKGDTSKIGSTDWMLLAGPMADVVSQMSNQECEYLLQTCMSVVRRQEKDVWAPVMSGGRMMYMDLKVLHMLRLVLEVIRHNLGDFFPTEEDAATS